MEAQPGETVQPTNSKLGVSKSRVSKNPQPTSTAMLRRNSTGWVGGNQSIPTKTLPDSTTTKTNPSSLEPLRRSMPELGKKLGPNSSVSRTLRTPSTSNSSNKSDSVTKSKISSPLGSTGSSTRNSVSRLSSTLSTVSSTTGLKKSSSKGSSPLARSQSSTTSSGLKKNSTSLRTLPSLQDKGSALSGRKKVSASEAGGSRLIVIPQVDIKGGDGVRLDLRGQRIHSLSACGMKLSQNLEFVYLRDNLLSSLEGIEILKHVKVLDLSFNDFKGPGFEPLRNCKVLQQLYLAGNQITSLSSLPELSNLEFLSVAQNKLKYLSMASQPRLQVLAASKNKISSLKGFPHLPALEHLRVEENPILSMPHLEAASILLVGSTLKKFNDRDLYKEEITIAKLYPAHTAQCIRDGWEFCSPEHAAESTFHFLMEQRKDQLPQGLQLKEASIDAPFEEDACRCHFIFLRDHEIDLKLVLKYQWYVGDRALSTFKAITDATSEVYSPKHDDVGKYLKAECIPLLGETEYPPIFAISSLVSPGTGCPKVLNLEVRGELVEGNIIRGYAEVAWCGGTPGNGVASWLRRKWNSSPVVIAGAEDEEYMLTSDDIGSSLVFMYTPVTKDGTKGEPQYEITDFVKAAPPSVSNVRVFGELVEGDVIKGVGDYFGGREGPSKFEWLRENMDKGDFELVLSGATDYTLTRQDIGFRMAFVYIPVNFEGMEGESASVVSDVVRQAQPKVTNTRIIGELREGSKITVTGTVSGGTESASRVQWFKAISFTFSGEDGLEPLSTSKIAKAFRVPLGAVGHYIVGKFTPMTPDGEIGEPAYVVSEKTVDSTYGSLLQNAFKSTKSFRQFFAGLLEPASARASLLQQDLATSYETLPPSLNFLSVTGDYAEGELLTASYGYIGGHEGKSVYNWYHHQVETDIGTLIKEACGHLQCRIPKYAIGKFLSFECIPARADGVIGEPGVCMGQERVRAGNPRLISLQIFGETVEGSTLLADKKYWGGAEGESIFRWLRIGSDGQQTEIDGATEASYTVSVDDIGCFVSVSCEPLRSDWARGPIVLSEQCGPIEPGLPTCQALYFSGSMTEGKQLTIIASYSGGERGNCLHEWFRVKQNGDREPLFLDEVLELALEDVGCRIEVVFTPVRKDGVKGVPQSVMSDVIVPADPMGLELSLPACCEAEEVIPQKRYFGGQERAGEYIWYRIKDKALVSALMGKSNSYENAIACGRNLTYTPSLDDVGAYLALYWVPTREDGKCGEPLISVCENSVAPAHPVVTNVYVKASNMSNFSGEGHYFGGHEGMSLFSWYRETADGSITLIDGVNSPTYEVTDSDYSCRLLFGYTPVRSDSVIGELKRSDPTEVILPEPLKIEMVALAGKAMEGDTLTAVEVIPNSEQQQNVWSKYKKDVKYQWYFSSDCGDTKSWEMLSSLRSCSYRLRFEDIGRCLRCECIVYDVFGRSSEPAYAESTLILPGIPRIDKLEIEGRGFHTNLYAVRGVYNGGREGKSRVQWLRSMVGSPDLISIPGETGRMYEGNVDDVGYRLVAIYIPVREDGVEGQPISASTEPIAIEPDVLDEVTKKLGLGSVKFEVLCNKAPTSKKVFDIGVLERRVLEINRKRVKVVKPGSKTSFPTTEIRGTYAPPFHVELFQNDQHRLRVVVDSENEVNIMVHTRHLRDVIVLVLRGLAQKFNSTSLNSLLMMET